MNSLCLEIRDTNSMLCNPSPEGVYNLIKGDKYAKILKNAVIFYRCYYRSNYLVGTVRWSILFEGNKIGCGRDKF